MTAPMHITKKQIKKIKVAKTMVILWYKYC